jgi:hypothetical protein
MFRSAVVNATGHFRAPGGVFAQPQMQEKRRQLVLADTWPVRHFTHHFGHAHGGKITLPPAFGKPAKIKKLF